jgi:hypothetical protein
MKNTKDEWNKSNKPPQGCFYRKKNKRNCNERISKTHVEKQTDSPVATGHECDSDLAG